MEIYNKEGKTTENRESNAEAACGAEKSIRETDTGASEADDGKNLPEKAGKRNKAVLSAGYYYLFMFLTTAVRIYFGGKAKLSDSFRKQKKDGAMLILCNHVSALDFVHMTPPMRGAKVNFVVAEHMKYSQPVFSKLISGYGAIQKKAFFADFQCIKSIKQNLDAGISVILCPEGKVSADGTTGEISVSTARLIKWLGYPVASMIINGAGLVRPKWAASNRRGKVITVCDMLFTKDDVKNLSKEDILLKIRAALAHNEHVFQIENNLKYRGYALAEGLEKLLYLCPKCGSEFKISTAGDILSCGECGNGARYTETGKLIPENEGDVCPERIDLWYALQKDSLRAEIENGAFALNYPVELNVENADQNGYRSVTTGILGMDYENITFYPDARTDVIRSADTQSVNAASAGLHLTSDSGSGCEQSTSAIIERSAHDTNKRTVTISRGSNGNDCVLSTGSAPNAESLRFPVKNFSAITNIPGTSIDIYDENHVYRFKFLQKKASEKYALAAELLAEIRERDGVRNK